MRWETPPRGLTVSCFQLAWQKWEKGISRVARMAEFHIVRGRTIRPEAGYSAKSTVQIYR
jgi:hypothetical protein